MSIMEVYQQDNAMTEGLGTSGRSPAFTATGEEGDPVDVVPTSNDVSDPNPATGRPGTTDIYTVDTVLPIHIVWHDEATAKSTTKYGRR